MPIHKLGAFGRLLIVRALREDRTLLCATEYVAATLGDKYVESHPLNLETTWAESNERSPLVCLLSAGSDPTNLIEALAKKMKKECRSVSMGQGQDVIAQRYMNSAIAVGVGSWVLLQNTHLGLGNPSTLFFFLIRPQ